MIARTPSPRNVDASMRPSNTRAGAALPAVADLDAESGGAEAARRRDDDAAVARAEVDDVIASRHAGELEHSQRDRSGVVTNGTSSCAQAATASRDSAAATALMGRDSQAARPDGECIDRRASGGGASVAP